MPSFQSAFDAPRPPYIRFETRPVERRDAAGNPTYIDVDFAMITQPGSTDTVDKIAVEWLAYIQIQADNGTYPAAWVPNFKARYEAWKKGQDLPVDGTSIKNWPAASPAEVKILTFVGVLTVEDLAAANDQVVNRIGMGGRSLKQRAIDFLQAGKNHAPLVRELDAARRENDALKVRMGTLEAQVQALLQNQQAQPFVPPSMPDLQTRLEIARDTANKSLPTDEDAVRDVLEDIA